MAKRTCSIDGCEKTHQARGVCMMHYKRWQVGGSFEWQPGNPCRECGTDFERMHHSQKFCSDVCRLRTAQRSRQGINRRAQLKKLYGITPADYDQMWEMQDRRCAICGSDDQVGRGVWHVDHDHETQRVRGILCHHCNTGIGHLKECPEILHSAIRYLRAHA